MSLQEKPFKDNEIALAFETPHESAYNHPLFRVHTGVVVLCEMVCFCLQKAPARRLP